MGNRSRWEPKKKLKDRFFCYHMRTQPAAAAVADFEAMKKYLFLALSIICLILGFLPFNGMVEGAFKGLAGVFFIIFYVLMLLGKESQETKDKSASH